MELFLNLAWLLMALILISLWVLLKPQAEERRRNSVIALAMLIVVLFPVVSVSDDLWSVQNPAESDTSLRRDHLSPSAHAAFPVVLGSPEAIFCGLENTLVFNRVLHQRPLITPQSRLPESIQNRPPPTA